MSQHTNDHQLFSFKHLTDHMVTVQILRRQIFGLFKMISCILPVCILMCGGRSDDISDSHLWMVTLRPLLVQHVDHVTLLCIFNMKANVIRSVQIVNHWVWWSVWFCWRPPERHTQESLQGNRTVLEQTNNDNDVGVVYNTLHHKRFPASTHVTTSAETTWGHDDDTIWAVLFTDIWLQQQIDIKTFWIQTRIWETEAKCLWRQWGLVWFYFMYHIIQNRIGLYCHWNEVLSSQCIIHQVS